MSMYDRRSTSTMRVDGYELSLNRSKWCNGKVLLNGEFWMALRHGILSSSSSWEIVTFSNQWLKVKWVFHPVPHLAFGRLGQFKKKRERQTLGVKVKTACQLFGLTKKTFFESSGVKFITSTVLALFVHMEKATLLSSSFIRKALCATSWWVTF